MTLSDPVRRALRTLMQVGLVTAVLELLVAFGVPVSREQQAALLAVATPLVAFAQNLLEDAGTLPPLAK